MLLFDGNVLVYAFRQDIEKHEKYRSWLMKEVNKPGAYGMCEFVFSSFLRITTHPKVFKKPSSLKTAIKFIDEIRTQPNCRIVSPGQRHWDIFIDLCRRTNAKGNLIPDAYLAALSIEWGCEWVTTDSDFKQFPGLKWIHPLKATK